ncbi:hypothetical protein [Nitrosomonas sp.]|uniref:hypothetical protein n=1 Tax=Nitrosomonas sp. TaxID=42353 RepID=UPI0033057179
MKTVFPTAIGCNGMFLVAPRRHPTSGTSQEVGVVLLKRHYQIQGQDLVPAHDPVGIRVTDAQVTVSHDGDSYRITDFESDMAPYKPCVDMVVRRHYSNGDSCQLHVMPPGGAAQLWFSRTGDVPEYEELEIPDLDARRHMFGWEQRALKPRRLQSIDNDENPPANAPVFDNRFFNGYRRNFAQGGYPASNLAAGSTIRITRSGSSTVELRLGREKLHAHVFVAEGSNPDRKRFWCRRAIPDMRVDTVVLSPQSNEAYLVWRGVWDYGLFPRDRYRELEVSMTETDE